MFEFNDHHKLVLERYNRPIVHMRKQLEADRFGLIFGAGLSQGCQLPTWSSLVEALAEDPEVDPMIDRCVIKKKNAHGYIYI